MKRKDIIKQAAKLSKEAARLSKKVDKFIEEAYDSKDWDDFIRKIRAVDSRAYDLRAMAGHLSSFK